MALRDEVLEVLLEAVEALKARVDDPLRAVAELTRPEIEKLVTAWLESNAESLKVKGDKGDAGPAPNADDVRVFVEIWLELNRESIRGKPGIGIPGNTPRKGIDYFDGKDAPPLSASEIYAQVATWLSAHRDELRGKRGDDGNDGVGIETMKQSGDWLIVLLTDGTELKFKLPQSGGGRMVMGVGGGLTREQVLALIEDSMADEDINDTPVPFTFTASGSNPIFTPASGKAVRLFRIRALSDPDATDAVELKLMRGATELQRGYVIEYKPSLNNRDGAADEALTLVLGAAGQVSGTAYIEEFTHA